MEDTGFYACMTANCTFFRIALDNKPNTCPMCRFTLSPIAYPGDFIAMHIRNGLIWRCTTCHHITVRHPKTSEKEAGMCPHCGGAFEESNIYELIVKNPNKIVVPLSGSTGDDNG